MPVLLSKVATRFSRSECYTIVRKTLFQTAGRRGLRETLLRQIEQSSSGAKTQNKEYEQSIVGSSFQ